MTDEILTIKFQSQALVDAGRFSTAAELLTRGLSIAPHDDDLLCRMAQVCVGLNQLSQAASYAESALAADPQNAWAHRLRSIALRQANRHESLKAAKEAVQLEPGDPWCWQVLTGAHLQVFNLREARVAAERLRMLAPEWYVSHQVLSLVALKEEKYKDAEAHCRRELELNPNSYEGMNNLGVALLNQKRRREAIEAFNRAAKINPVAAGARNNINVAVKKYLPRITIPIFALYVFVNGLRVLGEKGQSGLLLSALAAIGVVVGLALAFRWYRFRRLPAEVRSYISLGQRHRRIETRVRWLKTICILTGILFGLWGVAYFGFWTEGLATFSFGEFTFPLILLAGFLTSFIFLQRTYKDLHR
ncbi:MAG TPA: tetratricopeptide repeat protein [Pyrinomonadaceae bacterium]|nr:tetratricopeptide repeat protein [Pyrinomonadaceae bacterium]